MDIERKIPIAAVAMLASSLATASAESSQGIQPGLVVENCRDIQVLIEYPTENSESFGLTRSVISSFVNKKLEYFFLQPVVAKDRQKPYLYVVVNAPLTTFSIHMKFNRQVSYSAYGRKFDEYAVTWEKSFSGRHTNDLNFMLQALNASLFEFIDRYINSNPECRHEPKP